MPMACRFSSVASRITIGMLALLVVVYFLMSQRSSIFSVPHSTVLIHLEAEQQVHHNTSVVGSHRVNTDLVTAWFVSPTLDEEGIIERVRSMYATTKKIRHFYTNTRLNHNQFTVVMLSHNRTANLFHIFKHYCKMGDIINKFLVIWNNVGVPIPSRLQSMKCSFPIVFLPQSKNSLNNRFTPYSEIETECESLLSIVTSDAICPAGSL